MSAPSYLISIPVLVPILIDCILPRAVYPSSFGGELVKLVERSIRAIGFYSVLFFGIKNNIESSNTLETFYEYMLLTASIVLSINMVRLYFDGKRTKQTQQPLANH